MRKRGLCCRLVLVRPSVRCLFVRRSRLCIVSTIQVAEDIILVFQSRAPISNSKANPFSGGVKYTG